MSRIRGVIALLALVLCASVSDAAGIRYGFVAGPQLSELPEDSGVSSLLDQHWSGSWFAGGTVEVRAHEGWALVTGLEYVELMDHKTTLATITTGSGSATGEVSFDQRLRMLVLPVGVRWRMGPLRITAGPEASLLLGAQARIVGPSSRLELRATRTPHAQIFEQVGSTRDWYDVSDAFHRAFVGGRVALGAEFPLAGHVASADLRWSEDVSTQSRPGAPQTSLFQLALGMLW